MNLTVYLIQGSYVAATGLAVAIATLLWHNRSKPGAVPLCVMVLAGAVWAFGLFVSTLPWETLAVGIIPIIYLGVGVSVVGTFLFALEYTGRERFVRSSIVAVLSIHPIALVLVTAFNPRNIFFEELDPTVATGVAQEWAIGFWIHTGYSYLLTVLVYGMILQLIIQSKQTMYRGQALSLLVGLAMPLVFNALFVSGLVEFDTTPLGMIALAGFFTIAVLKYEFTNIAPIAREKVIDTVRDGVLVIDTDGRIIDYNPAVMSQFSLTDDPTGEQYTAMFGDYPHLEETLTALLEGEKGETVTHGDRHLHVEQTPIEDDRGRHVGWLLLVQDVTDRVQRERDLEQQIERLDQFASLVSHDLRNPMNVARGYVEQTQTTGDIDQLDKSIDAIDRMETIIEDVLTLAREGQEVTTPVETSLTDVARSAWQNVEHGEATLELQDDAIILADQSRLERLLENLFRNSLEHGIPDGRATAEHIVTVGIANKAQNDVWFYVADNGVGIPPADRDQVFEDGYSTSRDGTGLGLAIVRQIASAHGWEVTVTESDDGGARFEFRGVGTPVRISS